MKKSQLLAIWLLVCFATTCAPISHAQTPPATGAPRVPIGARAELNPFDKAVKVDDGLFVYRREQFLRHDGTTTPVIESDARDGIVSRNRIGSIEIASGVRVNVEIINQPMSIGYELRELKTGKLLHRFAYATLGLSKLLFSGQGVIYENARVVPLCWGRATRKYELRENSLLEVHQPLLWIDSDTELLRDVKLQSAPNANGLPVASLPKGTTATVISYEHPNRFLIKTPLGLVGWLVNDQERSSVAITQCN